MVESDIGNLNILIIGGTGTLGQTIIRHLCANYDNPDITVLSRDEHKQKKLHHHYPHVKCVLGDIRDKDSLFDVVLDKDIVIHAAALKHIDHLEHNPIESVKTNILGTINVADIASQAGVPYMAFCSTDKAVDPINVYGCSKSISEKILLNHYAQNRKRTNFKVYRWANVVGSQGSAIPLFVDLIKKGKPIPVTDPEMTRFWIKADEAVRFIFSTIGDDPGIYIPPMKATSLKKLIEAIGCILNKKVKISRIPIRSGEKKHESIHSVHDKNHLASNMADQFTRKELIKYLTPVIEGLCRR